LRFYQERKRFVPAPDGGYPGGNTAEGTNALLSRTSGAYNTAVGLNALLKDTTGSKNTANGVNALRFNTTGSSNTAIGTNTLFVNSAGEKNTATGDSALFATPSQQHGPGVGAPHNNTGFNNRPAVCFALTTPTAATHRLGPQAGSRQTASNVICIGTWSNVSNSCFIRKFFGVRSSGTGVFVNTGSGPLLSRRLKTD
jgi:hypothetical protein